MQRNTQTTCGGEQPTTEDAPVRSASGPSGVPAVLPRGLLFAAAAVLLVLVVATGAVAAHDNFPAEPGASGHCDSADDDGGSFAVHGPGDHENNFADAEEVQSAGAMAVYFAETQGDCGGSGDGYLEVHVISAQNNVQYCYSEESDGDDGDAGHGDEPTDNVTASAGAGEVTVNEGSRNYPPGHEKNDNDACGYNAHDNETSG